MNENGISKWQRELKSFLGIKNGVILEGNILDEYPSIDTKGNIKFVNLDDVISEYGKELGAEVIYYNPLQGFYCFKDTEEEENEFISLYLDEYEYSINKDSGPHNASIYMPIGRKLKEKSKENNQKNNQILMSEIVLRGMMNKEPRKRRCEDSMQEKTSVIPLKVFVLNFASRLEQCNMVESENTEMFMNLSVAINAAKHVNGRRNVVIFVVEKYNDIPAWVYINNPNIRSFYIETPDRNIRRQFIYTLKNKYGNYSELGDIDSNLSKKFVTETEGLLCREIEQVLKLAINEEVDVKNIKNALKLYKFGVKDSPWEKLDDDIVSNVNDTLKNRVMGQDMALRKVQNVIMRAIKGLSGLQHSNSESKPRGILFFAGPTGVGKTETAKAIAESIFGDEDACIRFDMSEYRAEQSDQKLFGAPPGYVGYEGGGQLTNAVKNHPFSVLLFDEIEKAHPTIMDKFLQILEDGRMTDNQGNTVYFSESIIIFTSNIGLTKTEYDDYGRPQIDPSGNYVRKQTIEISNVFEDDSQEFKEKTQELIFKGVKDYFINIGRPELLNRLGENNIVVFQFIDKPVAETICMHQMKKIANAIMEQQSIRVDYTDLKEYLKKEAIAKRASGGRGIGNMLEEKFINPFSEYICTLNVNPSYVKCSLNSENEVVFVGE